MSTLKDYLAMSNRSIITGLDLQVMKPVTAKMVSQHLKTTK